MIIGLTGKSCSGKNCVGEILHERGLEVWDLDEVAHDGLDANADAIIKLFGKGVVKKVDGKQSFDRKAISDIVFADPSMRTKLEGIIYPWLKGLVLKWKVSHPDGSLVLNGALLYRSGFNTLCDYVIYVDASYYVREKRAIKRDGITAEEFRLREKSQEDVDFRCVDYGVPLGVISNDEGDMDKLRQQVFNIYNKLIREH